MTSPLLAKGREKWGTPPLERLHGDFRFDALVKRVGIPD